MKYSRWLHMLRARFLLLSLWVAVSTQAYAATYNYFDLGIVAPANSTVYLEQLDELGPQYISDTGQIIGNRMSTVSPNIAEAVVWTIGTNTSPAPTVYALQYSVFPKAINANGLMVGYYVAGNTQKAFALQIPATTPTTPTQYVTLIGNDTDGISNKALGINGNTIVGSNTTATGVRAMRWQYNAATNTVTTADQLTTDTLAQSVNGASYISSEAVALNNNGKVLGSIVYINSTNFNPGLSRPFVWDITTGLSILEDQFSAGPKPRTVWLGNINNNNLIVGGGDGVDVKSSYGGVWYYYTGLQWTPNPAVAGGYQQSAIPVDFSTISAINDLGNFVGYTLGDSGSAFIKENNSAQYVDLNTSGVILSPPANLKLVSARHINNQGLTKEGYIVGLSKITNPAIPSSTEFHGYLLVPTTTTNVVVAALSQSTPVASLTLSSSTMNITPPTPSNNNPPAKPTADASTDNSGGGALDYLFDFLLLLFGFRKFRTMHNRNRTLGDTDKIMDDLRNGLR